MRATLASYRDRAAKTAAIDVIFDAPARAKSRKDKLELERHFNDLYAVFLHKLSAFALQREAATKQEKERLRMFFEELLKAKEALV